MENIGIIVVLVVLLIIVMGKMSHKYREPKGRWTCTSDKGDKITFGVPEKMEDRTSTRTAGGNEEGYDQVTSPEQFTSQERMTSSMVGDDWDPDSRDQIAAYHDPQPPSWSDNSLMYFGAVDAQVIQNHKDFTSSHWMFNQNAAFADFGDNPNYPYPVTSIRLNAINNVPTNTNPHQITEDQDDGGASRATYSDRKVCYGTVG